MTVFSSFGYARSPWPAVLWALAFCVASLLGPAAASAQENAGPPEVAINRPLNPPKTFLLAVPQNGPLANLGQQARQGAELALKTWGGGFKLETVAEGQDAPDNIDFTQVAMVLGYFTESAFHKDAPRYLYLKKPVLLPYLTNPEAAARGPHLFFRLMPGYDEQGRFMAMEMLGQKTRPNRILIIQGAGPNQAQLVEALVLTLAEPVQPEVPPVEEGKKKPKTPAPIKPLDSRAQVVTVDFRQALDLDSITDFGKRNPDLIVLAVGLPEALQLAPLLADSKFAKTTIWGGVMLGFRETGAAFASLKLRLSLCLPSVNLVNASPRSLSDFKSRYETLWRTQPTWIAALGYDAMYIAIKAASGAEEDGDLLGYLSGQRHHSLGAYELRPGAAAGRLPLAMMPVRAETLGFLP